MNWFKNIKRDTLLYGGLIITFIVLYGATAFVSFYHAIDLFLIGNAIFLAIILSFVAEIGQASALFSILLTKNKHKFLTWGVMIILTTLQVIGNVYASYDFIDKHNSAGVASFQKAILFFMPTAEPEVFKVIIAWILGALLPIIALSMTALVAQNMILRAEEAKTKLDEELPSDPIPADLLVSEVSKIRITDEELNDLAKLLKKKKPIEKVPPEDGEPEDAVPTEEEKTTHPLGFTDEDLTIVEKWKKEQKEFIDNLSAKNEAEVKEPDIKTESSQFKSSGVFTTEKEINHSPSIEEMLADLSPQEKQYVREKLDQEQSPDTPDEFHDLNKQEEIPPLDQLTEIPPLDQLTDEELEDFLSSNDEDIPDYVNEEIVETNLDDQDRNGTIDFLDDDAEALTPEIIQNPAIVVKHNHELVEGLTANSGESIEIVSPPQNKSEDKSEEEKKHQEEQRLEKIRRLAREKEELKKK